jgi:hypothetical protein
MLTDVLTLSSQIASMQSSDASIAIDTQQVAGDTWYNLILENSASSAVTLTATGSCTPDGQPTLSSDVRVFANVEAEELQLDIGNRCGMPIAWNNGGGWCRGVGARVPACNARHSNAKRHCYVEV